jgi:hypothetical protein
MTSETWGSGGPTPAETKSAYDPRDTPTSLASTDLQFLFGVARVNKPLLLYE